MNPIRTSTQADITTLDMDAIVNAANTSLLGGILVRGNLARFRQYPDLKTFLLHTGDRVIVEASPFDKIWGIGMTATHANAEKPAEWNDLNLLGFALMEVRERLRKELQP